LLDLRVVPIILDGFDADVNIVNIQEADRLMWTSSPRMFFGNRPFKVMRLSA